MSKKGFVAWLVTYVAGVVLCLAVFESWLNMDVSTAIIWTYLVGHIFQDIQNVIRGKWNGR